MGDLARAMPKAELHVHVEGCLEPEAFFACASRNKVPLKYACPADVAAAYARGEGAGFMDLFYEGAQVLLCEQDFHDLALGYLERAAAAGVRRAEVFFDPQLHTARGIALAEVVAGLSAAGREAEERLGVSMGIIPCLSAAQSPRAAAIALEEALAFKDRFAAVGLGASPRSGPLCRFKEAFALAHSAGLPVVVHAGEHGGPSEVSDAIDALGARRVDHALRAGEDPALLARMRDLRLPVTLCPLVDLRRGQVRALEHHPARRLLEAGVPVVLNSGHPGLVGSALDEVYRRCAQAFELGAAALAGLARASWEAAFVPAAEKAARLLEIDAALANA